MRQTDDAGAAARARPRGIEPLAAANLCALLLPGAAFGAGWLALRDDPRLAWLDVRTGSVHFVVIAAAGVAGTLAGIADWSYHRRGARVVGPAERRLEFAALAFGGAPLFAIMAAATLSAFPAAWLVPAIAVALATTVGICYDELTFHKRCTREETLYHRGLTFGMGVAWLAWAHGCFVAGPRLA